MNPEDIAFDLIGVGAPVMDIVAAVPESFLYRVRGQKGGMVMIDAEEMTQLIAHLPEPPEMTPGGSAANTIFNAPQHPYTRALLESVPRIDQSYSGARRVLPSIAGRPPDLLHAPPGCRFHDRCPEAAPECRRVMPREHLLAPGHSVSCLRRGSPGEEAP